MEVAAIIAIALLDYADFALIVTLLFVNATISYVEEASADKAIKALAAALAPKAKVSRGRVSLWLNVVELGLFIFNEAFTYPMERLQLFWSPRACLNDREGGKSV